MLDLDDLLRSLSDDAPSGPDLEYDADFTALVQASQMGEERVVGASVIPAAEPDYATVAKAAIGLLGQTRDIRIAVILAHASLKTGGLPAFEEVMSYMRRSLEDYWDSVHPGLDEEDDDDPTMRINAVLGLIDRSTVLAGLRSAPLTDSRAFGRFALRDLQIAEGEVSPGSAETASSSQAISAAFQDTDPAHLVRLAEAVDRCRDHVKAISAVLDDRVGSLAPDLDPLRRVLHDIRNRISVHIAVEVEEDVPELPEGNEEKPVRAATGPVRAAPMGEIGSPDDVRKAIDRLLEYYARFEPSSPIPLLLNRARRLVSADFVTILKDMAPQGVENVALIGGIRESDD
jgi:type VI secretion system protein ImpA